MKSKKYLLSTLFFMLLTIGVTVFAGSFGKTIRVKLTESYNFLLNNKQILQDKPAIFYNNILYVPAKDFAKELGYTVEYDNSTAVITQTPNPTSKPLPKPTPETSPTPELSSVTGTISAIDFASKRLVIQPDGKPKSEANQVIVFANDATKIISGETNEMLTFEDLDTNLRVTATYQTLSTKSIPPQTRNIAQTITILTPAQTLKPQPR